MKIRELFTGERQAILKLRKEGKSISAVMQMLGNNTTWQL